MTVSSGTSISAANYNTLQNRVARLLGAGTGQLGYGQVMNSYPVRPLNLNENPLPAEMYVRAEHMNLLLQDINRIAVHQFGSETDLKPIVSGDSVKADGVSVNDKDGFNQYIAEVGRLEDDPNRVDGTQVTIETIGSSSRFTPWNGQLTHSFTLTFDNADHRRAFFNAGGQIWISSQIEGTTNAKGDDWKSMLNNMGTIYFKSTTAQRSGDSSGGTLFPDGEAFGNFTLTESLQTLFLREGQAVEYAENRYYIFVKEVSNRAIQFTIQFQDQDLGDPNVDEQISGTVVSIVRLRRPTGNFVSVNAPSYSVQSSLELGG